MRRTLLIGAAVIFATSVAAHPARAADKVILSAKVTACTTGDEPAARAATFAASMPTITDARRMWMRFSLYQRRAGEKAFSPVAVPGWTGWEKSDVGRPGFIFTKRVESLVAPAAYRATVRFRWLDKHGKVLRQTSRVTDVCLQPDPRPDLHIGQLDGRATKDPQMAIYEVVVRNNGRDVAPVFGVVLTIGGQAQPAISLGPLAPDTRELGRITAPRCAPGDMVTIAVDPDGVVDEAVESDNVVQRPCPLGG